MYVNQDMQYRSHVTRYCCTSDSEDRKKVGLLTCLHGLKGINTGIYPLLDGQVIYLITFTHNQEYLSIPEGREIFRCFPATALLLICSAG